MRPGGVRGPEKLHALLARRRTARLRHGRIRPPHLAGGRRTNRAGPVARVHDARRRRNAGTRSPGRPHPEALGGRDDRIPVLHQGARQRPLQRTDDLVPRRLQPRAPPLRRRHGLSVRHPKEGNDRRRTRAGGLHLPRRLHDPRTLRPPPRAQGFRMAVLQLVREHLRPGADDAARSAAADVPARAGRAARRAPNAPHGIRPRRLPRPLPERFAPRAATAERAGDLSQDG